MTLWGVHPNYLANDLILAKNLIVPKYIVQYLTLYQLNGIRFIYEHYKKKTSCILNDESGMGKTATGIAFLTAILHEQQQEQRELNKKCVILCKNKTGILHWMYQISSLTNLKYILFDENQNTTNQPCDIVFLPFDTLRNNIKNLSDNILFEYLIIDGRPNRDTFTGEEFELITQVKCRRKLFIYSKDVVLFKNIFLKLADCCRARYQNILSHLISSLSTGRYKVKEKLYNYAKPFRLRRFKHQLIQDPPLVNYEIYRQHFRIWKKIELPTHLRNKLIDKLEDSYIPIVLSLNEDNFCLRLQKSPKKLKTPTEILVGSQRIVEDLSSEEMSPLLFESETDNDMTQSLCSSELEIFKNNDKYTVRNDQHKITAIKSKSYSQAVAMVECENMDNLKHRRCSDPVKQMFVGIEKSHPDELVHDSDIFIPATQSEEISKGFRNYRKRRRTISVSEKLSDCEVISVKAPIISISSTESKNKLEQSEKSIINNITLSPDIFESMEESNNDEDRNKDLSKIFYSIIQNNDSHEKFCMNQSINECAPISAMQSNCNKRLFKDSESPTTCLLDKKKYKRDNTFIDNQNHNKLDVFEITTNEDFPHRIRINSETEMSPIHSENVISLVDSQDKNDDIFITSMFENLPNSPPKSEFIKIKNVKKDSLSKKRNYQH